jgi:hypothetical protein
MPAAFAFSAMRLPMMAAAAALLPLPAPPICAHFGFRRGCRSQHLGAVVGNDAGVDVQVGAVHSQAHGTLLCNADARLTRAAQTLLFLGQHDPDPYFFLVSLITTFSSA